MFKNRFLLVLGVLSVLLVTMAISRPFASAPTAEGLSWPSRPVVMPVTSADELSDYYQRHSERSAPAETAVDMADYFIRHPELRGGKAASAHPALQSSPIDECFDVSISELAACREANQ